MPDPIKKPLKAPLVNKYKGAEKVNFNPTDKGYKEAETIGNKTFYSKSAEKPIPGGKAGKEWKDAIIAKLGAGVSPEELADKGHIDPTKVEEFRQYYKPIYTETTVVDPIKKQAQLSPFAGLRKGQQIIPDNTGGLMTTVRFGDVNGQANKSIDRYFDPSTGKEIDPNASLQNGNYKPSFTGKSINDYSDASLRSDAQGETMLPNKLAGIDVIKSDKTKILNEANKQGTLASDTGGGFKNGGVVGKLKKYAEGGNILGATSAAAPIAGQGLKSLLYKNKLDEQGRIDTGNAVGDYATGMYAEGLADAGAGAAAGSAFGPLGTGIGAAAGFTFGAIKGGLKANKDRKSIASDEEAAIKAEQDQKIALQQLIQQESLRKQLDDRSQGLKNGGKIQGKGSGTSDSIVAKVKQDSFVVPEKNAEKAEIIRKTILKAPVKKANLNQSGGEKVKLSNGEHLFTPKEVEKIENVLGDNFLDKLAPNSAKKEDLMEGEVNEMKKGGMLGYKKGGKTIQPDNLNQIPTLLNTVTKDPEVNINSVTPSEQIGYANKNKKLNLSDLSRGANALIDYGIPIAQTAYGLSQLKKMGKRPVGELDKDYLQSIEQAKSNLNLANANAKFGFTPEEQALINNENQNLTNAQRYGARNLSGGSAGNAYNLERSAINDSFSRGLKAKLENRNLMLQKQGIARNSQQYLDSLNASKADMSRQLFADKLNAWQQNQQSGAGLLGAGLQNLIGAKRYQDELAANKEANDIRNSWSKNLGE